MKKADIEEIKNLIVEHMQSILTEEFLKTFANHISVKICEKMENKLQDHERYIAEINSKIEVLEKVQGENLVKVNDELIDINNKQENIAKLTLEMDELKKVNKNLEASIEKMDQISRNLNVRLFGVGTNKDEDVRETIMNIFHEKMKLEEITLSNIKQCYRISTKSKGHDKPQSSAILVRFSTEEARSAVLRNKKLLKPYGIIIREDLTKFRSTVLKSAFEKFNYKDVWCLNAKIYVRCNGNVHRINDIHQLTRLQEKASSVLQCNGNVHDINDTHQLTHPQEEASR